MAAGCYPVVSAISANAAWIEDRRNGRLVDVEDHQALADTVEQVMADEAELRRTTCANRVFAETHLDLMKNTAAFCALFERLTSSRSPAAVRA
jgi:glycosyltransferase involved in cell wall biosynthesis